MTQTDNVQKNQELGENLRKILHRAIFCTFCLNINEDMLNLEEVLVKGDWEGVELLPLNVILNGIFGNADAYFLSKFICNSCLSSAISSYAFITKSRRTAKTYLEYLMQLHSQISDIVLDEECQWQNTLIVLDGIDNNLNKSEAEITKNVEPKTISQISDEVLKRDEQWKNTAIVVDGNDIDNNLNESESELTASVKPKSIYICDLCGKQYSRRQSLIKHIRKHKSEICEPIDCPRCRRRPCQHEKYLAAVDGQMMQQKDKITCIDCNKPVKSAAYLIVHVTKAHLESIICNECGKSFSSRNYFDKHFRNYHSKCICDICFQTFVTQDQLNAHVLTCTETLRADSNNSLNVSESYPLKHSEETKPKISLGRKRYEIYKFNCVVCNKAFRTAKELIVHSRLHKKSNFCAYCNVSSHSRQEFIEHTQTPEHKRNLPYTAPRHHCKFCDYSALGRLFLEAHVNRVHLKIRPFKCQYCPNSYFSDSHLKVHLKIHTGQRKTEICYICGAALAGLRCLKKHMSRHTGEKPYSCSYCGYRAAHSCILKEHVRTVHVDAPVACPLCRIGFQTLDKMRQHVRKVHWKSKEKFDYTKLKGLSPEDYNLFLDRRRVVL